jgi:hypothetical protein
VAGHDDGVGAGERVQSVRGDDPEAGRGRHLACRRRRDGERVAPALGAVAEDLRRRREVERDDAGEDEGHHAVHGGILAHIGDPATGAPSRPREGSAA